MPLNDLTPAHLRALIAAATPGPWTMDQPAMGFSGFHHGEEPAFWTAAPLKECPHGEQNHELILELVNNAAALADALEAKELLEALMGHVLSARRGNTNEWMEGLVETLNATEMAIGGKDRCEYRRSDGVIRVRRAAKEAHDGNI